MQLIRVAPGFRTSKSGLVATLDAKNVGALALKVAVDAVPEALQVRSLLRRAGVLLARAPPESGLRLLLGALDFGRGLRGRCAAGLQLGWKEVRLQDVDLGLLLGGLAGALVLVRDVATGPHGAQKLIPEGEERLREVGLNAPALVVDIVVQGVVRGDELEGIQGEGVATVVVDGLDGGTGEEPHGLADAHASDEVGNSGAKSVQEKALNGVVVESAVCVRDV